MRCLMAILDMGSGLLHLLVSDGVLLCLGRRVDLHLMGLRLCLNVSRLRVNLSGLAGRRVSLVVRRLTVGLDLLASRRASLSRLGRGSLKLFSGKAGFLLSRGSMDLLLGLNAMLLLVLLRRLHLCLGR